MFVCYVILLIALFKLLSSSVTFLFTSIKASLYLYLYICAFASPFLLSFILLNILAIQSAKVLLLSLQNCSSDPNPIFFNLPV